MIDKNHFNGTKIPMENIDHKMGLIKNGPSTKAILLGNSSNNKDIFIKFPNYGSAVRINFSENEAIYEGVSESR